jgi:hypothetical protein
MKTRAGILTLALLGSVVLAAPALAGWGGGEETPTLGVGQSYTTVLTAPTTYHTFHFSSWASGATFLVTTYQTDYSLAGDDTVIRAIKSDNTGYLLDDDAGPQSYSQAVFERRGVYEWVDVRSYNSSDLQNTKVVITRLK